MWAHTAVGAGARRAGGYREEGGKEGGVCLRKAWFTLLGLDPPPPRPSSPPPPSPSVGSAGSGPAAAEASSWRRNQATRRLGAGEESRASALGWIPPAIRRAEAVPLKCRHVQHIKSTETVRSSIGFYNFDDIF